jgi:hypothetical protein
MRDTIPDRPLFIGGPHRSGTGMMRAVLGSNSQLAIVPTEYQFFDRLPVSGADAVADLEAALGWPKVREWQLPSSDAAAMLVGTDRSRKAVYDAPLRAYAAQRGKPRFGEKTPYLERHFPTLLAWYGPAVRFVHIIRDPLPTFMSLCYIAGAPQPFDPVKFAREWRASAMAGLSFSRSHPDQFICVPYESFTADPESWTHRLCAFCDLPPETDAMLAMQDFARKQNSSFGKTAQRRNAVHAIVSAASDRHPPVSSLNRWLIERELGALVGGIGPFLAPGAMLPTDVADDALASAVGTFRRLGVRVRARLR